MLLDLALAISIALIMGGNQFYFHGSSLAVKLLPQLPTPDSSFWVDSSLTDFYTGTTNYHHSGTTVQKQEPAPLSPLFYLAASRQTPSTSLTPQPLSSCSLQAYINLYNPQMVPKAQQWQHDDSSNHTLNPQSGKPSWKHAPQKLEKCQASDLQTTTNKQASKNKDISHPTHYHPFQLKCLSQVSTLARPFSRHHPTQP